MYSSEEILALCAEAADTSNSPEIGPPPVSRFVDEDAIKADGKMETANKTESRSRAERSHQDSDDAAVVPKLDYQRKPSTAQKSKEEPNPEPATERKQKREPEPVRPTAPAAPTPAVSATKAGTKRKLGDENENVRSKTTTGKENAISIEVEKSAPARDLQKKRTIKELPAGRRERNSNGRTPLSSRSPNEDISSPRKVSKESLDEVKRLKTEVQGLRDVLEKERTNTPKPTITKIKLPPPEPPATATVLPESEREAEPDTPLITDDCIVSPDTPDRPVLRDAARDTPPPGHLSVDGETSRPSRRARAAISYAEPNLRDKMRRPTKELFDAVSGEGKKFTHRSSMAAPVQKTDEKEVSDVGSKTVPRPAEPTSVVDAARRKSVLSPLAPKEQPSLDVLPSSVVLERRRRPSAIGSSSRESLAGALDGAEGDGGLMSAPAVSISSSKPRNGNTPSSTTAQKPEPSTITTGNSDIYDFAGSPPSSKGSGHEVSSNSTTKSNKRNTSRRTSATPHTSHSHKSAPVGASEGAPDPAPPTVSSSSKNSSRSTTHSRKRASMMAPKRTPLADLLDGDYEDLSSIGSGGAGDDNDRVSRRKSMML